MELKEFDILLDIKKSKKIEDIEVVQKDYESNVFNISIVEDFKPYNLAGLNVEIAFAKSDGTTVLQDENNGVVIVSAIEGKVICTLKTNTIAAPGKVLAEVRILQDLKLLTTARFDFFVRKAIVDDETIKSTNEFPVLNEKIDEVNDLIEYVQGNEDIRNTNEIARVEDEDIRIQNENTRIQNEDIRQTNEQDRVNLYNDLIDKVNSGYFNGKNLEFHWNGTSLGVRVEGETEYIYVDLKGETGDIENLTSQHIETALGYTPVKSVNNVVADEIGNVELDIDTSEIENRIDNAENDIIEIKNRLQFSPVKSWADVQHIVRQGLADKLFKVGDQFVSEYDGGEIIWEVIGIDVDTPADSNFTHSMTIQTKDCLHDIQFDAPEPNNPDSDRQNYGNNRYIHSAVRQWLNSSDSVFNWQSQHQYDAKPTSSLDLYNGAGFLYRLDPELVSVLGAVNKKVARVNVDGGGQDTFSDKVFLLSRVEVGLGEEGNVAGEFVYPFYDGITNAERIKQLNGSNKSWRLRSPYVPFSYSVRSVSTGGSLGNSTATYVLGLSPACVII